MESTECGKASALFSLVSAAAVTCAIMKPELIPGDRKSTRLNSSHVEISYAVFCLKKKKTPADYNDIIQYSSALLLDDPINLIAFNAKLLVLAQQTDKEEYKKAAQQRKMVQDANVSTGDGMSDDTPFYGIKGAYEYDILPFLGYTYCGEDKLFFF